MEKHHGFHRIEQSPERTRQMYLSIQEHADMAKEISEATLRVTAIYDAVASYRRANYEQGNCK